MSFRLCKNHKVYITTENEEYGIDVEDGITAKKGSAMSGTTGGGMGIYNLDAMDGAVNADCLIGGVIGIETPDNMAIVEEVEIYNGKAPTVSIGIGMEGNVTLLILKQNDLWVKLFGGAPFGLSANGESLFDGLSAIAANPSVGYRIIIFDGTSYNEYRHCRLLPGGYTTDTSDRDSSVRETVTFSTNDAEHGLKVADIGQPADLK